MFASKTVLITGGTGSFGNAFIKLLLAHHDIGSIIVFSRDEKKHYDMMHTFDSSKLRFVIGDVRERRRVFAEMKGVDYVFHAAALKHVPSCEFFPLEALKTNVLGSANVLDAAEYHEVDKVVLLSSDKAVYPINAMGMTKGLMEKLMTAKSRTSRSRTIFCAVRYGNVMYSRGSVIPLFVRQIKEGRSLTITNPDMTRFLMPLSTAVQLVETAIATGNSGDIFVRKSPAGAVGDIALACLNVFGARNEIVRIGIREGEKMHETLVTQEDLATAEEFPEHWRIIPDKKMNYADYISKGFIQGFGAGGYTSENTDRLTVKQIEALLLSLEDIQQELSSGSRPIPTPNDAR